MDDIKMATVNHLKKIIKENTHNGTGSTSEMSLPELKLYSTRFIVFEMTTYLKQLILMQCTSNITTDYNHSIKIND